MNRYTKIALIFIAAVVLGYIAITALDKAGAADATSDAQVVTNLSEQVKDLKVKLKRQEAKTDKQVKKTKKYKGLAKKYKSANKTLTNDIKRFSEIYQNPRKLAKAVICKKVGCSQWPAARKLINKESGWNRFARNSSSGACGLVQSLPCSKLTRTLKNGSLNDVAGQIRWFVKYCKNRYGSINGAWQHSVRVGWY